MQWFASAPSNIALIKYMGKEKNGRNLPANPSLSYTLSNLLTHVELVLIPGVNDLWEPLEMPGAMPLELNEKSQARFLMHLKMLKEYFNYQGAFMVRSSNNFPFGSGLASSASSFAALTKCACLALSELTQTEIPDIKTQAKLSRMGSGSSCRSFFSPWAIWHGDEVDSIDIPYSNLHHQVILISHKEKAVSSSLAHERVQTSPLYPQRHERARDNLNALLDAFKNKNWFNAYEITKREFLDMHALFETCTTPFSYMTKETHSVLSQLENYWATHQDGPLITMDAGPNIHLLWREEKKADAEAFKRTAWVGQFDVL
jgi:diphosphomevalonate decarboxylase